MNTHPRTNRRRSLLSWGRGQGEGGPPWYSSTRLPYPIYPAPSVVKKTPGHLSVLFAPLWFISPRLPLRGLRFLGVKISVQAFPMSNLKAPIRIRISSLSPRISNRIPSCLIRPHPWSKEFPVSLRVFRDSAVYFSTPPPSWPSFPSCKRISAFRFNFQFL